MNLLTKSVARGFERNLLNRIHLLSSSPKFTKTYICFILNAMTSSCQYCHRLQQKIAFAVTDPILRGTSLTATYVKENWKSLIAFVLAWGVILGVMGLTYGFEATARPLAIGLGLGLLPGILFGIVVVNITQGPLKHPDTNIYTVTNAEDEEIPVTAKYIDYYSLWGLANKELYDLVPPGTRAIAAAILVNIMLVPLIPSIPLPIGGAVSFLACSYLVPRIAYWQFIKDCPDTTTRTKVQQLEDRLRQLEEIVAQRRDGMERRNSMQDVDI